MYCRSVKRRRCLFTLSRGLDYSLAITAAVFLAVLFSNGLYAYSIQGDCVVEENAFYKITQCPHTIHDFDNLVNVTVKNKDSSSHAIDIAFGFDTNSVKPTNAWLWTENAPHQVPKFGNVTHTYTCGSPHVFTYTLNPNYTWCNESELNQTVIFEHDFLFGYLGNKSVAWNEWEQIGWDTEYYPDWVAVGGAFSQLEWRNKTWYYRENINFAAGEEKTLRARLAVKPFTEGKYDLFGKLSSDSFQEAWDSGRYVLLDPWWDTNWLSRKNLTVTETQGVSRTQEPFVVNVSGITLLTNNCSQELRVLAQYSTETSIAFEVINSSGQTVGDDNDWCVILFPVNLTTSTANATHAAPNTTNYVVYYENAAATTPAFSELRFWGVSFGGWRNPNAEPSPHTWANWSTNDGTTISLNYLDNRVQEMNDTSGSGHVGYILNPFNAGGASTTWEFRARQTSVNTSVTAGECAGMQGTTAEAGFCIRNGYCGLASLSSGAFFNSFACDSTQFHVYRTLFNPATSTYSVYTDGVLSLTGTNATTGATGDIFVFGAVDFAGAAGNSKGEIDYLFIKRSNLFIPLTSTLGAEDSPVASAVTLLLDCRDETTNASLNCSFSAANSSLTYSVTDQFNLTYTNFTLNRPTGSLVLTANKTGYSPRTVNVGFYSSNVSVTIYLLNQSISTVHAIAVFTVTSAFGTLAGASVNLSKMVGGSPVLLSSGVTDGFGTTNFYVDSTSSYQLNAFKTGYGGVVLSLVNPLLTSYTIVFSGGISTAIPVTCLTAVSTALSPSSHQLFRGVNQNVTWTIVSATNNLSYWGWRVDWNGTIVNTSNNTNPSGGVIVSSLDFNVTNASGLVGVQYFWNVGVGEDCVRNDVFFVNNVTGNTGLLGALSSLKTDTGIGDNALALLALLLITSMVVFASRYTVVGGAAIGIIMLSFFTFITNWINPTFFLLLAIGGIAWTYFAYQRGL